VRLGGNGDPGMILPLVEKLDRGECLNVLVLGGSQTSGCCFWCAGKFVEPEVHLMYLAETKVEIDFTRPKFNQSQIVERLGFES